MTKIKDTHPVSSMNTASYQTGFSTYKQTHHRCMSITHS